MPVQPLERLHVDRVDVRALLAVDLDGHDPLVHLGGDVGVLEGLVLHHVAPVARGVADAHEHRLILGPGLGEGFLAPGVPVHGVLRVLKQVGGRFVDEAIGHGALHQC